MQLDGSDVVLVPSYYKNVVYRDLANVPTLYEVFLDWGTGRLPQDIDVYMEGSPYQLTPGLGDSGFRPGVDCPVLEIPERWDLSQMKEPASSSEFSWDGTQTHWKWPNI